MMVVGRWKETLSPPEHTLRISSKKSLLTLVWKLPPVLLFKQRRMSGMKTPRK
jgi:hypothetical protein